MDGYKECVWLYPLRRWRIKSGGRIVFCGGETLGNSPVEELQKERQYNSLIIKMSELSDKLKTVFREEVKDDGMKLPVRYGKNR